MFRSNQPVIAEAFINRREALQRVEQVLEALAAGAPQWLAILGSRKIGKTSLLLEASRRFRREDVVFIAIDVLDAMPVSLAFFRRLVALTMDSFFAEELGVAPSRLLKQPAAFREALLRSARYNMLSAGLRSQLLELPTDEIDESFVREAIDLPERLAEALGLRLLLTIDEFQELAALGSRRGALDPLPLMRSRWQCHQRVAYVISGSARSTLTELVTAEHSPFFQHFALLELDRFEADDAISLLVVGAPADKPIDEHLARRAAEVLDNHPFYLQLFGEALTALDPPYDDRSLKAAMQNLLFSSTGRLALYFQNEHQRLVGGARGLASTLDALAHGAERIKEVADRIEASTGVAAQYVKRLSDAVRREHDGSYHLADPVFAAWLRWRAPGGSVVSMKALGDEGEAAVAEHLSRMGFDLVYQSRGSRGAFDLLATRGATQLGVQVKRSALPLRFSREVWQRMQGDAKRWGWRWVVAAVDPADGAIVLLDPRKASRRKEVRLHSSAIIDNLLAWLEATSRARRT